MHHYMHSWIHIIIYYVQYYTQYTANIEIKRHTAQAIIQSPFFFLSRFYLRFRVRGLVHYYYAAFVMRTTTLNENIIEEKKRQNLIEKHFCQRTL